MRKYVVMLVCAFMTTLAMWAQQDVAAGTMVLKLKSGETVELETSKIDKVTFDAEQQQSSLIKLEEVGKTFFRFSINANGEKYIFAAFETGYIHQYGEDYMLAIFGHIKTGDATYEWVDGTFYEFEDIKVQPGRNYTILAAIYPGEGQRPDKIERVDLTTLADEQSESSVALTLSDITGTSVKVTAEPGVGVSSYVVFVKDRAWIDDVLTNYGESLLLSTTEKAVDYGMAKYYVAASEEVWEGLTPDTAYGCIVVVEDEEGKKNVVVHDFTTAK